MVLRLEGEIHVLIHFLLLRTTFIVEITPRTKDYFTKDFRLTNNPFRQKRGRLITKHVQTSHSKQLRGSSSNYGGLETGRVYTLNQSLFEREAN